MTRPHGHTVDPVTLRSPRIYAPIIVVLACILGFLLLVFGVLIGILIGIAA